MQAVVELSEVEEAAGSSRRGVKRSALRGDRIPREALHKSPTGGQKDGGLRQG
jgi:hypothetical protein